MSHELYRAMPSKRHLKHLAAEIEALLFRYGALPVKEAVRDIVKVERGRPRRHRDDYESAMALLYQHLRELPEEERDIPKAARYIATQLWPPHYVNTRAARLRNLFRKRYVNDSGELFSEGDIPGPYMQLGLSDYLYQATITLNALPPEIKAAMAYVVMLSVLEEVRKADPKAADAIASLLRRAYRKK